MKLKIPAFTLLLLAFSLSATHGQDYDPYSWDPGKGSGNNGGGSQGLFGVSDMSYGYLEGSYYSFDFSDEAIDSANGFGIDLALPIVDSFYVQGSLVAANPEDADGNELDSDYVSWELGAGLGLPVSGGFDFIIEGGIARREFVGDFLDDPVDGYGIYLAPGFRWLLNDFVEIDGTVKYYSVDDLEDFGFEARALLHLTPSISLQGSAYFGDIENHYGVGLRLSF